MQSEYFLRGRKVSEEKFLRKALIDIARNHKRICSMTGIKNRRKLRIGEHCNIQLYSLFVVGQKAGIKKLPLKEFL